MEALRPYFDFRDELSTQDPLIFKGSRVIVPAVLQTEMMVMCRETHMGVEGCIRSKGITVLPPAWPLT